MNNEQPHSGKCKSAVDHMNEQSSLDSQKAMGLLAQIAKGLLSHATKDTATHSKLNILN